MSSKKWNKWWFHFLGRTEFGHTKLYSHEPFWTFCFDQVLPNYFYDELVRQFPEADWFPEGGEGNKREFNSKDHPKLVNDLRSSRQAVDTFLRLFEDSIEFWEKESKGGIEQARGKQKKWVLTHSLWDDLFNQPVHLVFQFSRLEKGAFVPVHTDFEDKLLSIICYIPEEDWGENGALIWYKHKENKENWRNLRVPFEDVEPLQVNNFIPNRIVGFTKGAYSYHGVLPIQGDKPRQTININIMKTKSWGKRLAKTFGIV